MTDNPMWQDERDEAQPDDARTADNQLDDAVDEADTPAQRDPDFDPFLTPPLGELPDELKAVVMRVVNEQGEPKPPPEPVSFAEAFPPPAEAAPGDDLPFLQAATDPAAGPLALSFTAQAALRVVPASNFLRYGPTADAAPGVGEASSSLVADVTWQQADGAVLLAMPGVSFTRQAALERDAELIVWLGQVAAYGLELAWVWDFFRVLARVQVRVRIPAQPTPAQRDLAAVLLTLEEGDALRLLAPLPTGDLEQLLPLGPAFVAARAGALSPGDQQEGES